MDSFRFMVFDGPERPYDAEIGSKLTIAAYEHMISRKHRLEVTISGVRKVGAHTYITGFAEIDDAFYGVSASLHLQDPGMDSITLSLPTTVIPISPTFQPIEIS